MHKHQNTDNIISSFIWNSNNDISNLRQYAFIKKWLSFEHLKKTVDVEISSSASNDVTKLLAAFSIKENAFGNVIFKMVSIF